MSDEFKNRVGGMPGDSIRYEPQLPPQPAGFVAGETVFAIEDRDTTLLVLSVGAQRALRGMGFGSLQPGVQFAVALMPASIAGYVLPVGPETHQRLDGPQLFERLVHVTRSVVTGLEQAGFKVKDPTTLYAEQNQTNAAGIAGGRR